MILDALPAHIALLDSQGFIVSVNESWRRFATENGYQNDGFGVGLNYLKICDESLGNQATEAQTCAAGIRSVLCGLTTTFSIEYSCDSSSEQRWFLLTVTAFSDEQLSGATAMHMSITDLRLAELALKREGLRNRAFLRNASDAVVIVDATGTVNEVSDSFCKMLGFSREELLGANPSLWDAKPSPDLKREFAMLFSREERSVVETQHRRKDGTILEVEFSAQRLQLEGQSMLFTSSRDISQKRSYERQILSHSAQIEAALMSTIDVVTALSELRDPYTAGHERRVGGIASAIGTELGLDASQIQGLSVAGQLHDIGKISIPSEILSMPGKLSPIQKMLVQEHAQTAFNILKHVVFPWPVALVALQHHERLDGSGYPQGLRGDTILLEAKIVAVADVVEAMSSHRPYRPALGLERAMVEIERGRGTAYDSTVVDACLNLFRQRGHIISG
jgi:PAS domain S-box-containing protein